MQGKIIRISTDSPATVLEKILSHCPNDIEIIVDGKILSRAELSENMNARSDPEDIGGIRDFEIRHKGRKLYFFKDGPRDIWAAPSEIEFIKKLQNANLLNYGILSALPSKHVLLPFIRKKKKNESSRN
ncbi:MAG: hypothetical protein ABIC40_05800 [bacterium]